MKLNLFAAWVGYFLILVAVVSLGSFLVAAGSGNGGWAVIAGSVCVVSVAIVMALIGGTVHHDHQMHRESPHIF